MEDLIDITYVPGSAQIKTLRTPIKFQRLHGNKESSVSPKTPDRTSSQKKSRLFDSVKSLGWGRPHEQNGPCSPKSLTRRKSVKDLFATIRSPRSSTETNSQHSAYGDRGNITFLSKEDVTFFTSSVKASVSNRRRRKSFSDIFNASTNKRVVSVVDSVPHTNALKNGTPLADPMRYTVKDAQVTNVSKEESPEKAISKQSVQQAESDSLEKTPINAVSDLSAIAGQVVTPDDIKDDRESQQTLSENETLNQVTELELKCYKGDRSRTPDSYLAALIDSFDDGVSSKLEACISPTPSLCIAVHADLGGAPCEQMKNCAHVDGPLLGGMLALLGNSDTIGASLLNLRSTQTIDDTERPCDETVESNQGYIERCESSLAMDPTSHPSLGAPICLPCDNGAKSSLPHSLPAIYFSTDGGSSAFSSPSSTSSSSPTPSFFYQFKKRSHRAVPTSTPTSQSPINEELADTQLQSIFESLRFTPGDISFIEEIRNERKMRFSPANYLTSCRGFIPTNLARSAASGGTSRQGDDEQDVAALAGEIMLPRVHNDWYMSEQFSTASNIASPFAPSQRLSSASGSCSGVVVGEGSSLSIAVTFKESSEPRALELPSGLLSGSGLLSTHLYPCYSLKSGQSHSDKPSTENELRSVSRAADAAMLGASNQSPAIDSSELLSEYPKETGINFESYQPRGGQSVMEEERRPFADSSCRRSWPRHSSLCLATLFAKFPGTHESSDRTLVFDSRCHAFAVIANSRASFDIRDNATWNPLSRTLYLYGQDDIYPSAEEQTGRNLEFVRLPRQEEIDISRGNFLILEHDRKHNNSQTFRNSPNAHSLEADDQSALALGERPATTLGIGNVTALCKRSLSTAAERQKSGTSQMVIQEMLPSSDTNPETPLMSSYQDSGDDYYSDYDPEVSRAREIRREFWNHQRMLEEQFGSALFRASKAKTSLSTSPKFQQSNSKGLSGPGRDCHAVRATPVSHSELVETTDDEGREGRPLNTAIDVEDLAVNSWRNSEDYPYAEHFGRISNDLDADHNSEAGVWGSESSSFEEHDDMSHFVPEFSQESSSTNSIDLTSQFMVPVSERFGNGIIESTSKPDEVDSLIADACEAPGFISIKAALRQYDKLLCSGDQDAVFEYDSPDPHVMCRSYPNCAQGPGEDDDKSQAVPGKFTLDPSFYVLILELFLERSENLTRTFLGDLEGSRDRFPAIHRRITRMLEISPKTKKYFLALQSHSQTLADQVQQNFADASKLVHENLLHVFLFERLDRSGSEWIIDDYSSIKSTADVLDATNNNKPYDFPKTIALASFRNENEATAVFQNTHSDNESSARGFSATASTVERKIQCHIIGAARKTSKASTKEQVVSNTTEMLGFEVEFHSCNKTQTDLEYEQKQACKATTSLGLRASIKHRFRLESMMNSLIDPLQPTTRNALRELKATTDAATQAEKKLKANVADLIHIFESRGIWLGDTTAKLVAGGSFDERSPPLTLPEHRNAPQISCAGQPSMIKKNEERDTFCTLTAATPISGLDLGCAAIPLSQPSLSESFMEEKSFESTSAFDNGEGIFS